MTSNNISKKRDPTYDLLKLVAIFMVLLQHCMFYFGNNMGFLDTIVGKIIVIENMPLFVFISGFFSGSIYNSSFHVLLKQKYKSIIRPTIIYTVIGATLCFVITSIIACSFDFIEGAKSFVIALKTYYWFIWVLLYCVFFSWLTNRIVVKLRIQNKVGFVIGFIISALIVLAIPDINILPGGIKIPHLSYFKSMYPFFILGYIFKMYDLFDKMGINKRLMLVVLFLAYSVLLVFYQGNWCFYYFTLMPFPRLFVYYIIMIFAGMLGIVLFYQIVNMFAHKAPDNKMVCFFANLGQYTLAIYLMQGILMQIWKIFQEYTKIEGAFHYTLVSFITAVVLLLLCSVAVNLLSKNKLLSAYLLGK